MKQSQKTSLFNSLGFVPVVALVILAAVGIGGTATAAAAQDALPGETLYVVKEMTENARLAVALDSSSKAQVRLAIAEEKLSEIEELQDASASTDLLALSVTKLEENDLAANEEIEKAQSEGKDVEALVLKLESNLERQQTVLTKVLEDAPEPARKALEQAIQKSQKGLLNAIEMQQKKLLETQEGTSSSKLKGKPTTATSSAKPINMGKPANILNKR